MAGNLRALLAEFVGAFLWVCVGAGLVCADAVSGGRLGPIGTALGQGLAVACVFALFAGKAPGLCNPALALGRVLTRQLDPFKGLILVLGQLLGAAAAAVWLASLYAGTPIVSEAPFLGTPLTAGLGFRSATLVEGVLSFFLALAAFTAGDRPGNTRLLWSLACGFFVCAAALWAGPLTGCALNPARAFGPAVVSGYWTQQYVYWIGPAAGAATAAFYHKYLL